MQQETGSRYPLRESTLKVAGRDVATVHVCTVDRFQGHEADLVFVSIASKYPTSFLECPNRLNVAFTRARYQLFVVGNRDAFLKKKGGSTILNKLAESLRYWLDT